MSQMNYKRSELTTMTPREFREIVRQGQWTERTELVACLGYAQANLVVVPKDSAFDFLLFCNRNPRACPVMDVTDLGNPRPRLAAPDADLRTDLPRYRVYRDSKIVDEPTDVTNYWRDDLVAFLIGCSVGIDEALQAANVHYRILGVYTTTINCVPAGRFHGPMAVTCRLVNGTRDAVRTIQISSRYPLMHGPPVHIGDPTSIGIEDLYHPDIGFPRPIAPQEPDEIAMFWGCGVTPQLVAIESKVPFMITHYPAHMFVTDWLNEELAVI